MSRAESSEPPGTFYHVEVKPRIHSCAAASLSEEAQQRAEAHLELHQPVHVLVGEERADEIFGVTSEQKLMCSLESQNSGGRSERFTPSVFEI